MNFVLLNYTTRILLHFLEQVGVHNSDFTENMETYINSVCTIATLKSRGISAPNAHSLPSLQRPDEVTTPVGGPARTSPATH